MFEYIKKKKICTNCGNPGHEYKYCAEPITSFGIINFKIISDNSEVSFIKNKFILQKQICYQLYSKKYPDIKCKMTDLNIFNNDLYSIDDTYISFENEDQLQKFTHYRDKILFMMVSRRFSLGFIEFVRGKYEIHDAKGIINLFEQMTEWEINFLSKNDYDDILYYFIRRNGSDTKESILNNIYEGKYSSEYCEAKIKFNILREPQNYDSDNITDYIPWNLYFYTKHVKPRWKKPEWGFPKGRREKKHEENINCACREFEEETGYNNYDYNILNKIQPIEEKLVGTNGVQYKHTYYISINESDHEHLNFDKHEIGDIKWFTYSEAISNIRPYHQEKKMILTKIYLFILNYLITIN